MMRKRRQKELLEAIALSPSRHGQVSTYPRGIAGRLGGEAFGEGIKGQRSPRFHFVFVLLSFLALAALALGQDGGIALSKRQDSDNVPPVILSLQRLEPGLRSGNRRVMYSPDGTHLLVQDDSGVRVFTRKPLKEKFYVYAPSVLAAVFATDSKKIMIASAGMKVATFSVEGNGEPESIVMKATVGACMGATLSPMGNSFACIDGSWKLHLYELSNGEEVFSTQALGLTHFLGFWDSLSAGSAFSEPFGIKLSPSLRTFGNQNPLKSRMLFSPEGRYLFWESTGGEMAGFDLIKHEKMNLPASLRHRQVNNLEFLATDRIAMMSTSKADESALLSFPSGQTINKMNMAGQIRSTSAPGYVIYRSADGAETVVMDFATRQVVAKPVEFGSDVSGHEVASFREEGILSISTFDGSQEETARTSAGLIPMIHTAAVSDDLSTLVLGVGEGDIFQSATGKSVKKFDSTRGAWCDKNGDCYVSVDDPKESAFEVMKVDSGSSEVTTAWRRGLVGPRGNPQAKAFALAKFYPSGPVVFSYALKLEFAPTFALAMSMPGGVLPLMGNAGEMLPYTLRALEVQTGKELWKRDFENAPPVPFTDPQGDRLVLGWSASSDGAKKAAKGNPVVSKEMKQEKKLNRDSFFEVLDAQTGKSLGGVLIELTTLPDEFDSAFSEADWLVLEKDGRRVFVESLSTGKEILKIFGWRPAISAASAMMCLSTEERNLAMYDLKTGQKLRDFRFSAPVSYVRFSGDGRRLLVVTEDQAVGVLDISNVSGLNKMN